MRRPHLIPNWRAELNRLWSIKLAIWGSLLASGDTILYALSGAGLITPAMYGFLLLVVIGARLWDQHAKP